MTNTCFRDIEDDAVNGRFQITWQIFLGKPSEETSGKMDSITKSGISTGNDTRGL
jgi:hypothetical protein